MTRLKWQEAVQQCSVEGRPHVLVTVLATSGSTPRAAGTKMVIEAGQIHDSIGGGQFEYLVIARARDMLNQGLVAQRIEHFPLAAAAQQCCGGSVTVLLECFADLTLRTALFGAGHVGEEVHKLLVGLNANVAWFDSRASLPAVEEGLCRLIGEPLTVVAELDPAVHALVMTHDHQLDFALVDALLAQGVHSIGLIGSETKWERFRARLAQAGWSEAALARVRCPVGDREIGRKDPPAVALSIVAELLKLEGAGEISSLSWRQVRSSLVQDV